MTVGKNLGFDLEENRALCLQLSQYKEGKSPFDLPIDYGFHDPINWWSVIDIQIPYLWLLCIFLQFALIQLPVKEDSLIWKCRLQLGIENLESMCKMITYWKSNARKEFGFFDQETQKSKLSDIELNQIITESLAEPDDNIDDDFEDNLVRRTAGGEIIPDNTVTVLIENISDNDNSGKGVLDYDINDLLNEFV